MNGSLVRAAAPRCCLPLAVAGIVAFGVMAQSAGAVTLPVRNGTCVETTGEVFAPITEESLPGGGSRITYRCGPIDVTPGQNRIEWPNLAAGIQRPDRDGWITRIKPDLVTADGASLRSDYVMFHHGVWLNRSRADATAPSRFGTAFPERMFAAGEEKTIIEFPPGFGYRYKSSDAWALNHMLHNLVPQSFDLYIQYTIDFYPDGSEGATGMTQVRPIWMDVQNTSFYPVFDVWKGQGGSDGEFAYPEDVSPDPYEGGDKLNEWTVDRDGSLVGPAGHVHAGGLWTDLNLIRKGASYEGPRCGTKATRLGELRRELAKANRRLARLRSSGAPRTAVIEAGRERVRLVAAETRAEDAWKECRDSRPRVVGNKVRLFRSDAKYFKREGKEIGPISWDMGMHTSDPDWRPQLRKGDTLQISTTYETKRGSWFESMGINFSYMADGEAGQNPYRTRIDDRKHLNHGPLAENRFHGGKKTIYPDARGLAATEVDGSLLIGDWTYESSDFKVGQVAAVRQGEQVTFQMTASDVEDEIWHSLTSCKAPCNKDTGISYPIPDGKFQFDSGQLGPGNRGPIISNGTVGRLSWDTPSDMPVGTYTFFCRIHPDMRGAIRVLPRN
ncbi:MAG: hypothetical protein ACKORM_06995 [Solirubrobacterales bacterium]